MSISFQHTKHIITLKRQGIQPIIFRNMVHSQQLAVDGYPAAEVWIALAVWHGFNLLILGQLQLPRACELAW